MIQFGWCQHETPTPATATTIRITGGIAHPHLGIRSLTACHIGESLLHSQAENPQKTGTVKEEGTL